MNVEDVIPRLEVVGFGCEYGPESDIPGGWVCMRGNQTAGDWMQVSIASDETGPIESVFSYMAKPAELNRAEPGCRSFRRRGTACRSHELPSFDVHADRSAPG